MVDQGYNVPNISRFLFYPDLMREAMHFMARRYSGVGMVRCRLESWWQISLRNIMFCGDETLHAIIKPILREHVCFGDLQGQVSDRFGWLKNGINILGGNAGCVSKHYHDCAFSEKTKLAPYTLPCQPIGQIFAEPSEWLPLLNLLAP